MNEAVEHHDGHRAAQPRVGAAVWADTDERLAGLGSL